MRKTIPIALCTTAAAAIPLGIALTAHTPATSSTAVAATSTATATQTPTKAKTKHSTKPATSGATHTYVGPSADMEWGPVQVTIVVKASAVTDLSATAPTERARSALINDQAIPMLRQEVLQAKTVANIKNIYGISGATLTSEAFYQSLLAALHSAHLM